VVTREQIVSTLERLNAAENGRPHSTVEETSARIDAVMSPEVQGYWNGVHMPGRAAEKEGERRVFDAMPDYHRDIERTIIEPPLASIGWTIRGTVQGREVVAPGCSVFEFNDEGKVRRYWGFTDMGKFAPPSE
jgi:hypothetical protein